MKKFAPRPNDAVYGLGVLGAFWYFISTAGSFTAGLFGIVKAVFWPAILVFQLLKSFGL